LRQPNDPGHEPQIRLTRNVRHNRQRDGAGKRPLYAFRRFREAVLQASECRGVFIDYWMSHSNTQMGNRYSKQLVENRKFRAKWAKNVGLGFEIPKGVISEPALKPTEQETISLFSGVAYGRNHSLLAF
jgi:hypothetical protein